MSRRSLYIAKIDGHDNLLKIGISGDPVTRALRLSSVYGSRVVITNTFKIDSDVLDTETLIHSHLYDFRDRGAVGTNNIKGIEIFDCSQDLAESTISLVFRLAAMSGEDRLTELNLNCDLRLKHIFRNECFILSSDKKRRKFTKAGWDSNFHNMRAVLDKSYHFSPNTRVIAASNRSITPVVGIRIGAK